MRTWALDAVGESRPAMMTGCSRDETITVVARAGAVRAPLVHGAVRREAAPSCG